MVDSDQYHSAWKNGPVSKVFYSFIICQFNNFFPGRIFYQNKFRVALRVALRLTACRLGPVSRKPRKPFGPVKPFLIHLYLKAERFKRLKFLV